MDSFLLNSGIMFVKPKLYFRKEAFGGLAFDPIIEEYFYLDKNGFELLKFLNNKAIRLEDIKVNKEFIKSLIENRILAFNEKNETKFLKKSKPTRKDILSAPTYLEFYPTFKCNERCHFCYVGELLNRRHEFKEFSKEQIDKFVKKVEEIGVFMVVILGGEPILYPEISYLIDRLSDINVKMSLSTNGTVLRKDIYDKIIEKGVSLNISFHSFKPEVSNKIVRNSNGYNNTIKTIKYFLEKGAKPHISTVIYQENVGHIEEHVAFLGKLGIKSLGILNVQRTGFAKTINNQALLSFKEYKEAYKKAQKIGKEYNMEIVSSSYFPFLLPEFTCDKENPVGKFLYGCTAGLSSLYILPNGDIYPCSYFFNRQEWIVGNFINDDFKKVWDNSPIFEKFRNRELVDKCKNCEFKKICRGGIICQNLLERGITDPETPNCPIYTESEELRITNS